MRVWGRLIGCAMMTGALGTGSAQAEEWVFGVGPGWRLVAADDTESHRVGLSFGGHFTIDDFWQLGASGEWMFPLDDGGMAGSVRADVRWLLDVLTWVPFIEASVGLHGQLDATTDSMQFNLMTLGSLGIDYRPERDWSIGARVGGGALFDGHGVHAVITRVDLQAIFHFD